MLPKPIRTPMAMLAWFPSRQAAFAPFFFDGEGKVAPVLDLACCFDIAQRLICPSRMRSFASALNLRRFFAFWIFGKVRGIVVAVRPVFCFLAAAVVELKSALAR